MYHYAIEWYRQNKGYHKLKNIYEVSGLSKQSHTQYMNRREAEENLVDLVINSILEVRSMHTMMGLKKIYYLLLPDWIGRDRFIEIGVENGLGIKQPRSYSRTTFSNKGSWFYNLLAGFPINDINQVWVSDITYFRVNNVFYYLTFILDIYSRRILGYVASTSLHAEASCKALKQAILSRKGMVLKGLIHHSDRGCQYTSEKYLRILSDNGVAVSMCDSVYENTHIERVNGIIKNEYLSNRRISTFSELENNLKAVVKLYNEFRPHWSLNCITPVQFEEELKTTNKADRESMYLYYEKDRHYRQKSLFE